MPGNEGKQLIYSLCLCCTQPLRHAATAQHSLRLPGCLFSWFFLKSNLCVSQQHTWMPEPCGSCSLLGEPLTPLLAMTPVCIAVVRLAALLKEVVPPPRVLCLVRTPQQHAHTSVQVHKEVDHTEHTQQPQWCEPPWLAAASSCWLLLVFVHCGRAVVAW